MIDTLMNRPCTFVATDGRRCVLHESHKSPRKRKGHYVTYGDVGDGHLIVGEQSCKWGDGPKGEATVDYNALPEGERAAFLALTEDPTGTEVPETAIQPRMFALAWSGDAHHWLGRIARAGFAREVRPGVWVALAERAA